MLPNARVIHCRCNPVDTCLSIYMQDFAHTHACLRSENTGYYCSSSYWQARQPIYASSISRWQNYRKHLDPLTQALGIPAD
jgi:hypothetical protein